MTNTVSKDAFMSAFGGMDLASLAKLVKQETGKDLRSTTQTAAVDEAYEIYAEHVRAAAGVNTRASAQSEPLPPAPAEQAAPAGKDLSADDDEPPMQAVYEGRCKTERGMYKFGIHFGPKWATVDITDEEAEAVKDHPYIRVRVKAD